jgi:imidazolonepropionase-like amidohydrolase
MTRTLFAGGRVFDGTGSAPSDADVVVENGRFVDVGSGLDGDERIDVAGKTLLPGLFDCHVHVAFAGIDMMGSLTKPFSLRFYEAMHNLRRTLDIGITTVRDAGGADLGMKTAVDEGLIDGPRMQISLVMLSQTGGHGDSWMPCGAEIPTFGMEYPGMPSGIVDGPEEMRRKVRELIRDGADVIKVATSGGVLSPRDEPKHPHFRDEELEMLVSEASAAGIWAMAHAQGTPGIKAAIRAGIRSIDHGVYLDDAAIEMMIERETYLVPTLVAPTGVIAAAEAGVPIPENMVTKARGVIDAHRDSFKRAVAAGVKVAMGTDSAVTPHGENLKELALMAEGGMDPAAVLVSTTSLAAELMGLQDDLGTIESGKRADIVVVDGDPFDFVTLPDRIVAVYKDGRPVKAA